MGEPIPGSSEHEIVSKKKFEGFVVANGISIKVYWHREVGVYVLEFPFLDVNDPEVKRAGIESNQIFFTTDDKFAGDIFYDTRSMAMTSGEEAKIEVYKNMERVINHNAK